jgi:hypothetical protein
MVSIRKGVEAKQLEEAEEYFQVSHSYDVPKPKKA